MPKAQPHKDPETLKTRDVRPWFLAVHRPLLPQHIPYPLEFPIPSHSPAFVLVRHAHSSAGERLPLYDCTIFDTTGHPTSIFTVP